MSSGMKCRVVMASLVLVAPVLRAQQPPAASEKMEVRVINVDENDRVVAAVKLVEKVEENGGPAISEENVVH